MTSQDPAIEGIQLAEVGDPAEGAFTVRLPLGWQHQAHSIRPYGVHRTVINARSPDGATFLFLGDPQLPSYTEPRAAFPGMGTPLMQVYPYTPAEPFFTGYVRQRHGGLPGFRILSIAPCAAYEQELHAGFARHGMRILATAVSLTFEFMDGPRRVRSRLHGATVSTGDTWTASLFGAFVTNEIDPARWDDVLFAAYRSYQTDPRWRQMQDQAHAGAMSRIQQDHLAATARMQQQHQANMEWIQSSASAHQARMDSLHAAADARDAAWAAQQGLSDSAHGAFMDGLQSAAPAGPDSGHARFLNAMKEEETVVSPSGESYQVEAGFARYYRHQRDGTWIGAGSEVGPEELRARFGVNPDDYEEVRVRR